MSLTIPAAADTITGVKLVATRKGVAWPLPADAAVVSGDSNILLAALAGDAVGLNRAGAEGGSVEVTATAGGLVAKLDVAVEAAGPDAIAFDADAAVVA